MDETSFLLSRRELLAGASALAIGPALSALSAVAAVQPVPKALDKAQRWIQLALVEKDPATFDPQWWLDFFKRVHADGACISAGGMCAFYPTDVPDHHRSEWLGDKDVFGDLVRGCRKMNMAVIARVDPHCVRDDAAQAHPEWVAVDANGQKARHMVMTDRWLTCGLGPCNMDFMPLVLREIVTKYDVDGFFANRWSGHITCYCDSCKGEFKKASGLEAPLNSRERGWAEFQKWRQARLFEVWDTWDAAVRLVKPECCCLMNLGGAGRSEMTGIGQRAEMVAADRQGRTPTVMLPWVAAWNAKVFRSIMGDRPVAGITSVGNDDAHRWKDSVQSPAEIKLWLLECIAGGMRPWTVKFCGTLYDKRWTAPVEEVYNWHAANERFMRDRRSMARVAIVWSPQTSAAIGNSKAEASQMGICQALVEGRIAFEMVYEQLLDQKELDRFKLLILPDIAALSSDQCESIRQFVKRGGSLVATFETSLYDETGKKRSDFGLADLFGVGYAGKTVGPVKNSYMNVEHDTQHEVLRGFENAGRTINTINYADVQPAVYFGKPPLSRVPSYPDLPMEDVFPREPHTNIAEVYLRELGASRIAYFPGDIERTFWEELDPDHGRILANVIRWTLNEPDVVSVNGPGILDIFVWQQDGGAVIHLVNLTNPMMMKGPVREFIPIGPQHLNIRLPKGHTAREAKLLVSKAGTGLKQSGDVVSVTVPAITDHEVVAVMF